MKQYSAELAVDCRCLLGEGPIWDERSRLLLWTDINKSVIHRYDPERKEHRSVNTKHAVGCFALRETGAGAIAAGVGGIYWLDIDTGGMEPIINPEADVPGIRFNDGKCDAKGRFLAGSITADGKPEGSFFTIDHSLEVRRNLGGVSCSNGLAWSLDNRTLYYIDSPKLSVVAYDYNSASGMIGTGNKVIVFPEGQGVPDGMTIDAEGMLWIAEWGNRRVGRWNPQTGELLATVSVPSKFVTSCAFAGEGSNVLYITTASVNDEEHMHAGGLFRVTTDTTGLGTNYFRDNPVVSSSS